MRTLILAAVAALTLPAAPAAAQRLDTRVTDVQTTNEGVKCTGSAYPLLMIRHQADGAGGNALFFHKPVEADPQIDVTLGFRLSPREGSTFGAGAYVIGLQLVPKTTLFPRPLASARLLIDGTDSGVTPLIQSNPQMPGAAYVSIPEAVRLATAERMLSARWIDFILKDSEGTELRRYRFDALRARDAAEIASIIHFSCNGARAD